ncbi:MAG: carboxypeptidase-like regulatory domain-containing protein, partial [Anaerolineae bacterium]|nr:carboxypeptidase-like regulatory domain-containing protein [Anaerolineae bacterium]
ALLRQALPQATVAQLESFIRETARPLADEIPNNDSGWGLVDAYAAGLRVTAHGELGGRVLRPDGAGIPAAQIVIVPHAAAQVTLTAVADASGAFTVALRAGLYDAEGRAFGFAADRATGLLVEEGRHREVILILAPLPAGSVFGRVIDAATAAPLSATITVDAAPVQARSDPITGLYSLALPEGTWNLRFVADAHRIVRRAVTVTAATGQELNVALPPGPRLLLVDGGPWYYGSRIAYFADALEALDYPAHLWPIRDPAAQAGREGGPPDADLLAKYNLVIWSAPLDAPGLVNAGNALRTYLIAGGQLLLSGQDIAYFDGGGSAFDPPQSYFADELALHWQADGDLTPLTGTADGPLAGMHVAFNTADSARNQAHPDRVEIRNALRTRPLLVTPTGEIGAARTEICRPYGAPARAVWLGFGLEGVGPRATRLAVLDRVLDWLQAPAARYGVHVAPPAHLLIAPAGHTVSQTLHITNTGTLTDTFDLRVTGGPWPATLLLPDGRQVTDAGSFALGSCGYVTATLRVAAPPGTGPDVRAAYTLTVHLSL